MCDNVCCHTRAPSWILSQAENLASSILQDVPLLVYILCSSVPLPHSDLSWILSEVENLASLQELSIYLSLYLRVWHSQLSLLDITIREAR